MKEDIHIYSTSRLKKLQDSFAKWRKDTKTYLDKRNKKNEKTVVWEKPQPVEVPEEPVVFQTPEPSVAVKPTLKTLTPKRPAAKKRLTTAKKHQSRISAYFANDYFEKISVIFLISAIIFFIVLGLLLSITYPGK